MSIPDSESTNKSSTSNRAVNDGNNIRKFGFESAIEVGRASDSDQAVGVGKACENANLG